MRMVMKMSLKLQTLCLWYHCEMRVVVVLILVLLEGWLDPRVRGIARA